MSTNIPKLLLLIILASNNDILASNQRLSSKQDLSSHQFNRIKFSGSLKIFLDNREYERDYNIDETIAGTRQNIISSINIDHSNASWQQTLYLGYDWLSEFGAKNSDDGTTLLNQELPNNNGKEHPNIKISNSITFRPQQWLIYSHVIHDDLEFMGGHFPQKYLLLKRHPALWDLRYDYYRPNIEGLFIHLKNQKTMLWIDWTSRQTMTANETFATGIQSFIPLASNLKFSFDSVLFHYAANAAIKTPVRDNFGSIFGFTYGQEFTSESGPGLQISLKALTSYDRQRAAPHLNINQSLSKEVSGLLDVTYENDQNQYSLSLENGGKHQLMHGDSFYHAPYYNKIQVGHKFASLEKGQFLLQFSVHQTPDHIAVSQKISIDCAF